MRGRRLFPQAVGSAAVLAAAGVYRRFREDLRAVERRAESGGRVVQTARGAIEYGEAGQGFPVLAIHGAGGGYDQALLVGRFALGEGYRVIAPSRFGYLRSPAPADRDPEAQADLLASLLDLLDIERVAVAGVSAGGLSGLQFALRHPGRTAALVLVAAITVVPTADGQPWREREGAGRGRASEFGYWLCLRVARSRLLAALGVPREAQALWSEDERAQVDRILEAMLPFGARSAGYALDRALVVSTDLPLARIRVPTLVIHAQDDALVNYANAQEAVARIPGAEAMAFEQGGHLLLGQYAHVQAGIRAFLDRVLG